MVDRLEELLARLEAEEEQEDWEEPETIPAPAPPAGGRDGWEADGEKAPEAPAAGTAQGWTAEGPEGREWDGEVPDRPPEALPRPERARREERRAGEPAATGPGTGSGGELEALYRQAARAASPLPPVPQAGQAGRSFRGEEPGRTTALTVEELDRAVRRDSRRYDGGMEIY